jgi:broad specificity phosphatase PhoE
MASTRGAGSTRIVPPRRSRPANPRSTFNAASSALEELRSKHPHEVIALVSHLDVIRTAVLHCAGTSLDLFDRFEISPASITSLSLDPCSWRVLATNDDAHAAPEFLSS